MKNSMFQYKEAKNPTTSNFIWFGIIVVILAPIITIALMSEMVDFNSNAVHPSDNELIENFQQNDASFNNLVSMSNEDSKVERIAFDFTRVTGENQSGEMEKDRPIGFSKGRWNEYRAIFNELKLQSGLTCGSDLKGTIIYLTASSKGMSFSGSSKGYVYSEQELAPVFDSLDEDSIESLIDIKHGVAYKKIKDHWYLSYDW